MAKARTPEILESHGQTCYSYEITGKREGNPMKYLIIIWIPRDSHEINGKRQGAPMNSCRIKWNPADSREIIEKQYGSPMKS